MFFAFSDTLTVGVTGVTNGDVDVKDSAVESMTQVRNNGNVTVAVILSGFFDTETRIRRKKKCFTVETRTFCDPEAQKEREKTPLKLRVFYLKTWK